MDRPRPVRWLGGARLPRPGARGEANSQGQEDSGVRMAKALVEGSSRSGSAGGRAGEPRTTILRAGVLEQDGKTSFCLVKNISGSGMKVKLYSKHFSRGAVSVRVADEEPIQASIKWIKDNHAGIEFADCGDPERMMRMKEKFTPRRRSLPRLKTAARAIIRMGGRNYPAQLCDISSFGAKVRTSRRLPPNQPAVIDLPDLPSIKAFVRWSDDGESGLQFATPIPTQVIGQWMDGRLRVSA